MEPGFFFCLVGTRYSPQGGLCSPRGGAVLAVVLGGQVGVGLDKGNPVVWDIIFREDGVYRALGLAGTAVDALIWVNEHGQLEGARLWLRLVDALHRAHINTGLILSVDARFGNDVGHGFLLV